HAPANRRRACAVPGLGRNWKRKARMDMINTVYKNSHQCHRKLNHQAIGSLREPALYLPALKDGASRAFW
ncbi:hypothetical protein, partial [uncultured Sphaerotilus sp.]|uniref:hypothetical protein n=1 Tax=uncultured Sphaerotilus sp. TaxID=474984 RepID=UPI0030CA58A0